MTLSNRRILIAGDDTATGKTYRSFLAGRVFEVTEAAASAEALELASGAQVVLSDALVCISGDISRYCRMNLLTEQQHNRLALAARGVLAG